MKKPKNTLSIIIIFGIFFCFLVLVFMVILINYYKINKNKVKINSDNLSEVKRIIESYNSIYISEEKSADNNYLIDIYAILYFLPYEIDSISDDEKVFKDNKNANNNENSENSEIVNDLDDKIQSSKKYKSNEEYYNNLLKDISKVLNYKNFRLIDKNNNISIEVICSNNDISSIRINGIEDYFIFMESELSYKNYKELYINNFDITSNILNECIKNNYKKINFGTKDSTFQQYDIYYDEGIYVRKIQNSIYNIIFTSKYKDEVIKGIYTQMNNEAIIEILGNPSFSDNDLNLIGYKGTDIYVFFYNGMISIYKLKTDIDIKEFLNLVDTYLTEKEKNIQDFMNELTYLWPDYSEYEYSTDYIFISYPLKALEIKVNYDDTNGILVYNNIKDISLIQDYLDDTDFLVRFEQDGIFEAEKRRLNKDKKLISDCTEYINRLSEDEKKLIGESMMYSILPQTDESGGIYGIEFISKSGENPNREIFDGINSYLWISDNVFVYSKYKKGIYKYNLEDGKITRLVEGDEEYIFNKYEDGILTYDKNLTVEIR